MQFMETAKMKKRRNILNAITIGLLITGLSACQKEEGPAERAGKAMDNAVKKTGEKIEKAGEKIQEAAEEAKK